MADFKIKIANGPQCPSCNEDGFDDWWRDPSIRSPGGPIVALTGSLRCHGCGKFFKITCYADWETHSTMRSHKEMLNG